MNNWMDGWMDERNSIGHWKNTANVLFGTIVQVFD